MSNNEILIDPNGTGMSKELVLTKMYTLKLMNRDITITEFFIIVGCYKQDPEDYIKAYCEIHKHEKPLVTHYEYQEATHHDPELNLLDLRYGVSDQGLAIYDHSNCTIDNLNYGWDLEDVLDTIQAQQEQKPTLTVV